MFARMTSNSRGAVKGGMRWSSLPWLQLLMITIVLGITVAAQNEEPTANPADEARPTLDTLEKELILTAGSVLSLTCTGDDPISWTWPDKPVVQIPSITERQTITSVTHEESGKSIHYSSTFTLYNLTFADTGPFGCYYTGRAPTSDDEVYVYISDGINLFAPWGNFPVSFPVFLPVHQGVPTHIPCIVTHPDVQVTLWKGKNQVEESSDLVYDPQKGFHVIYPNIFYAGNSFKCKAVYTTNTTEGEFNETQHLVVYLSYMASTEPPQPVLESSHNGNILIGEELTFTCSVNVELGTMVTMVITYPADEPSDRITTMT